jgi:hypothetical protein
MIMAQRYKKKTKPPNIYERKFLLSGVAIVKIAFYSLYDSFVVFR